MTDKIVIMTKEGSTKIVNFICWKCIISSKIFFSTPKVMMKKEGSTKIVNCVPLGQGFLC